MVEVLALNLNAIINGDALEELARLPAGCIDCVITSPPYYQARKYGVKTRWPDGTVVELGWEQSPGEFIEHLCVILELCKRILTPWGTLWVVIGDKSSSRHTGGHKSARATVGANEVGIQEIKQDFSCELPPGNALNIPERLIFAMQARGWNIRKGMKVIWHKPDAYPQPFLNQFTEDYERVLGFYKTPRNLYWTNATRGIVRGEKTREMGIHGEEGKDWHLVHCSRCNGAGKIKKQVCPRCAGTGTRKQTLWRGHKYYFQMQYEKLKNPGARTRFCAGEKRDLHAETNATYSGREYEANKHPLGRHKRTVWSINTTIEDFPVAVDQDRGLVTLSLEHFNLIADVFEWKLRFARGVWTVPTASEKEKHHAPFPPRLVKILLRAACPKGVCTKCGLPVIKDFITIERVPSRSGKNSKYEDDTGHLRNDGGRATREIPTRIKKVWCRCECGASFRRGRVADPFSGTNTTGRTAEAMGRDWLAIELKPEYVRIGKKLSPYTLQRWRDKRLRLPVEEKKVA